MTARDLTPAEARAEVEAFMGEGWTCDGSRHHDGDAVVWAQRNGCHQYGMASTFRAAVDALKAAWRDAVRPWAMDAAQAGYDLACKPGINLVSKEECVSRVLKEDSNG